MYHILYAASMAPNSAISSIAVFCKYTETLESFGEIDMHMYNPHACKLPAYGLDEIRKHTYFSLETKIAILNDIQKGQHAAEVSEQN